VVLFLYQINQEIGTMTKQKAWKIYENAPEETAKWERPDGGLLLAGCPTCGKFQTRESYLSGKETSFWIENIELVTDYSCTGIAKCACGQWVKWTH